MIDVARVSDLMTADPVTITPHDDLASALDSMRERNIRHLPVVDGDGELLGILSERDILRTPRADWLRSAKVDEVYTRAPETVDEDAPLADAARTLLDNKIGCLPVTRGSDLVGILTEADFVRRVLEELEGERPDEGRRPDGRPDL